MLSNFGGPGIVRAEKCSKWVNFAGKIEFCPNVLWLDWQLASPVASKFIWSRRAVKGADNVRLRARRRLAGPTMRGRHRSSTRGPSAAHQHPCWVGRHRSVVLGRPRTVPAMAPRRALALAWTLAALMAVVGCTGAAVILLSSRRPACCMPAACRQQN